MTLFTGFVVCVEDTKPPWFVIFGEFVVGAVSAMGQKKGWIRVFGIKPDQWAIIA